MDKFELLRETHKPAETRILFIGESPPANETFFYQGDSRLAKYTCEAFSPENGPTLKMSAFLKYFRARGCFLVDLCAQPVNHLPRKERKIKRKAGEFLLAQSLKELQPSVIVVVMKAISPSVARAATDAAAEVIPRHTLPFPAQGHERAYVKELRAIISPLMQGGCSKMPANPAFERTLRDKAAQRL